MGAGAGMHASDPYEGSNKGKFRDVLANYSNSSTNDLAKHVAKLKKSELRRVHSTDVQMSPWELPDNNNNNSNSNSNNSSSSSSNSNNNSNNNSSNSSSRHKNPPLKLNSSLSYISVQNLFEVDQANNQLDDNDANIDVNNAKVLKDNARAFQSIRKSNSKSNIMSKRASSLNMSSSKINSNSINTIPELNRETSYNSTDSNDNYGDYIDISQYDESGDFSKFRRSISSSSSSSSSAAPPPMRQFFLDSLILPGPKYGNDGNNDHSSPPGYSCKESSSESTAKIFTRFDIAPEKDPSRDKEPNADKAVGDKDKMRFKGLTVKIEDDNSPLHETLSSKSLLSSTGNSPSNLKNHGLELSTSSYDLSTISLKGTFHIGKWKIGRDGLHPSEKQKLRKETASNGTSALGNISFQTETTKESRTNTEEFSEEDLVVEKNMYLQRLCDEFVEIGALGNGASAMVVEALHMPTLTIVALKMLPVDSPDQRLFFKSELEVLYKNLTSLNLVSDKLEASQDSVSMQKMINNTARPLNAVGDSEHSPYIVSFYNAFVNPRSGMINLVLEYMDGGSLEDLVQRGGIQEESTLGDIAYQTLEGIKFIHKNNFIHRDIKPSNILLSTSGKVKIADFGIATVFDPSHQFANSFVGTVCYMSPERLLAKEYSSSADIWSFGMTMLAVSEGRFPLFQSNTAQMMEEKTMRSYLHGDTKSSADSKDDDGEVKNDLKEIGGYWGMISAICDKDISPPGPPFTPRYSRFVSRCLAREADRRSSADELLSDDFISYNKAKEVYVFEPRSVRNSLENTPISSKTPLAKEISSAQARRGSREKVPSIDTSLVQQQQSNHNNSGFDLNSPPKTPNINSGRDVPSSSRSDQEPTEEEISLIRVKIGHLDRLLWKVLKQEKLKGLGRIPSDNDIYDEPVVPFSGDNSDEKYTDPSEGAYDEFKKDQSFRSSSNSSVGGGIVTNGFVDVSSSKTGAPSSAAGAAAAPYRQPAMLPAFHEMDKWNNLVKQLDLPLDLVIEYAHNFLLKNNL